MSPDPSAIAGRPRPAPTVGRYAVEALLIRLGLAPSRLDFVAKASTSEVWRAETGCGPVAVRIAAPHPGKPADFDAETGLRRVLAAAGARIAAPLFDRRDRPDLTAADRIAHDARLLALAIALHHLCRAKLLGLPARRAHAVGRLRHDLAEFEAG